MDSPTVRVYDVLACGGFLLTEYRPSLEEEFAVGRDLETFRTPEELRDKIEYYIEHDSQRRRIAQSGQRTVLENYTYVQRGREFLKRVRSLLSKQENRR
jgi:spore maturation protein CgeB